MKFGRIWKFFVAVGLSSNFIGSEAMAQVSVKATTSKKAGTPAAISDGKTKKNADTDLEISAEGTKVDSAHSAIPSKPNSEASQTVKKLSRLENNKTADEMSSSAAIRNNRPFGIGVQYTPLSDFFLSYGAHTYFNSSARWQWGFSFLMGFLDFKGKFKQRETLKTDKADATGFSADVYVRYFIWNSFALNVGLGYRGATIDAQISAADGSSFIQEKLAFGGIVAPVFIGNHWSWTSGITLGCDWIGAYFPITSSAKATSTSSVSNSDAFAKLNQDLVDLGESAAKKVTYTLAVISLGYQF